MSLRLLPSLILLCLAALLVGVAPMALADDVQEDASAVSQLTAEELAALKQRLGAKWDQLDAQKKERIAKGVLRIRNLSVEDRQKLRERIARAREEKAAGRNVGKDLESYRMMRGKSRRMFQIAAKLGKGAGRVAASGLSQADRQAIRRLGARDDKIINAFQFHLQRRIQAEIVEREDVWKLPIERFPESRRKEVEALRARVAEWPASRKRMYAHRLAWLLYQQKMVELSGTVERPDWKAKPKEGASSEEIARFRADRRKAMEEYYRKLGEAVQLTWPDAFSHTVLELKTAAQKAANHQDADLLNWVFPQLKGRDGARGGSALMALMSLDRRMSRSGDKGERMRPHVSALVKWILVEDHKADPARVDAALAKPDPRERWAALKSLMKRRGPDGARGPGNRGGMRRGVPGNGNGQPRRNDRIKQPGNDGK